MNHIGFQTISDANGNLSNVIVPIEFWRKIQSELEKNHLLELHSAKCEPQPKFGSAKGLIDIADDFDEPLEDLRGYV